MGLATIDPHSQKEVIEIHKIPKFGVNYASSDRDSDLRWLTTVLMEYKSITFNSKKKFQAVFPFTF